MKPEKIEISGAGFRYEALVQSGLIGRVGELVRDVVTGDRCAVLADENSSRLFAERVCASLRASNYRPVLLTIPPGEQSKTLGRVEWLCAEMVAAGLDRSSFAIGLGGGVVGDLSGFAAAVFERGIPHVQIPTTLLAMVDSAIGGKTGVNLPAGKNLIGVIHHPALVLADTDALATLPSRELRQGYAEVIKHGIIRDAGMLRDLRQLDVDELVRRNIRIKAHIVAADPLDTRGQRALLNFGHTVGHAIERASDFRMTHGDCVSLGILAACHISIERAGFSPQRRDELVTLLHQFDLPTRFPLEIPREKILEAVTHDKKFQNGTVRFVLTPRLGEAQIATNVTLRDIGEAVAEL